MADDVVPDRLEEIKGRHFYGYLHSENQFPDRAWLIAEVERLRVEKRWALTATFAPHGDPRSDRPRDILANLISVHRSYMTDPEWLTHIELAELMIQALDIEGFTIIRIEVADG